MRSLAGLALVACLSCSGAPRTTNAPKAANHSVRAEARGATADAGLVRATTKNASVPAPASLPAIAGENDALAARDDVDPATRKSRAIEAVLERLAPTLSHSGDGLGWRDAGGGVRQLATHGRFGHAMIAARGDDGVLRVHCVADLGAARRVLQAAERSAP